MRRAAFIKSKMSISLTVGKMIWVAGDLLVWFAIGHKAYDQALIPEPRVAFGLTSQPDNRRNNVAMIAVET